MACERANHSSCSVFGCTNEHKSLFPLPSSAPLKNQWVDFIFSINASVCAKHFTDDCFLNLGKYRAGLEPLEIKSGSVPSLLGSATDLGQASTSNAYIQLVLSRDVACQTDTLETHTVDTQQSLKTLRTHFKSEEDCDAFGDRSTQHDTTSESLGEDAPGSSHMSSHNGELKIRSVYGKGEGPLAVDGHDTLFTGSKVEAPNSLWDCGDRLVCPEELSVQQTPATTSIKVEEDTAGGMPAVVLLSEKDGNDMRGCSTPHGAILESLRMDARRSSHVAGRSEELWILSVYGQGEGPMAVDGHDTLFAVAEPEASSSLPADRSVRLVRLEEPSGRRGGHKGRPSVLCGKVIPDNGNVIVRKRTPNAEMPYGCDQCTKRFRWKGTLKIHMRTHSGEKPYKCEQCAKRFQQQCNLKSHMRTHSGEKPYGCDQCVKRFGKSSTLKIHMRTHTGDKPYKCDQCTKRFQQQYSLKCHMRTHSGEKPYGCDQCTKRFRQKRDLKIHMTTHSDEKPYGCDQCTKRFRSKSYLKSHMMVHFGEKPYGCDQCTKRFKQQCNLKIHMRTHTDEKPYGCDQCTKRFTRKGYLKVHMMVHSGDMPYKCDQCTKGFGRRCTLKVHMRTHTGEKPYKCDQCAKRFRQRRDLKLHTMTHSGEKPYKCDQCAKGYGDSSKLKVHMMSHSGEKPYKCDQCAKRYQQKCHLKLHMMTHSGEKPYGCDQCTKGFCKRSSLIRHTRTHAARSPTGATSA